MLFGLLFLRFPVWTRFLSEQKMRHYKTEIVISIEDSILIEKIKIFLIQRDIVNFWEEQNELKCYPDINVCSQDIVDQLKNNFHLTDQMVVINKIEERNWNEEWEKSYAPVIIDNHVCVLASFHQEQPGQYDYVIRIDPKMSFGTGHHATTELMMRLMIEMAFNGKRVLDMGTGTGVLAILAEMMQAGEVQAIDCDSWAYENAGENIHKNGASCIDLRLGGHDQIEGVFDIVLANINKNILLTHLVDYEKALHDKGELLLSGILTSDYEDIHSPLEEKGFNLVKRLEKEQWLALYYKK